MGVEFHAELHTEDIVGYRVSCFEQDPAEDEVHLGVTYQEAVRLATGDPVWSCCGMAQHMVEAVYVDAPELRLSYGNARELLEVLGYADDELTADLTGSADPDELLGRVLIGAAIGPDGAKPAVQYVTESGAQVYEGGRLAGYFPEKLARLEEVCADARTRGRKVVWG